MGVAAYNRGSACISQQIANDKYRPVEFDIMDTLNALPKYNTATPPHGSVRLGEGHGGWWIYCIKTGYGYWYKTLHEAIKRWDIVIIAYKNGEWEAIPTPNK